MLVHVLHLKCSRACTRIDVEADLEVRLQENKNLLTEVKALALRQKV